MKPKGILFLKVLCQKSPVESSYPELMYKYCLYPPGYLVQRHLCFIEGVSLPLEARKEFRFHYTWLNVINSTEILCSFLSLTTLAVWEDKSGLWQTCCVVLNITLLIAI